MTENVIGLWKQRFPILRRGIGTRVTFTCDIIVAICVLHNMAIEWHEEDPENDPDDDSNDSSDTELSDDEQQVSPVAAQEGRAAVRALGQGHRDWLCRNFC